MPRNISHTVTKEEKGREVVERLKKEYPSSCSLESGECWVFLPPKCGG